MAPDDGSRAGRSRFYETISEAIADITQHGFDSAARVEAWVSRIRQAALDAMTPPSVLEEALRDTLRQIYRRQIERGDILKRHPSIGRFTVDRVKPRLRSELDRRIAASSGLIKLNRAKAIEETIQRFAGWATSIPAGGSDAVSRGEVKTTIRKSLAQLPFNERRVIIDQSHKLTASLSNILAVDGGAIALIWKSRWRQPGYNYREDHKERDGNIYLLRDSWAKEAGLVKVGPDGYYDEITAVGEEILCRCTAQYLHALRDLPPEMLTAKGRDELAKARAA